MTSRRSALSFLNRTNASDEKKPPLRSSTNFLSNRVKLNALKPPPDIPLKSKPMPMFSEDEIKKCSKTSFHPIMIREHDHPLGHKSFVKVYVSSGEIGEVYREVSAYAGSRKPIIDAGIGEISRYLLGARSAKTCAWFEMVNGYAVFHSLETEEVKNYISLKDKPLTQADITLDCFVNNRASFLELDSLDEHYREINYNINEISSAPGVLVRNTFTKDDLLKYRRLKDTLQCRMLDYFLEEDDGSPDNAGNGDFDRDCRVWRQNYYYKKAVDLKSVLIAPLDAHLRDPNYTGNSCFPITTRDIDLLPALQDAAPSKWFAGTNKYIKDFSIKTLSRGFFENDFTLLQKQFNASLKDNALVQFIIYSFLMKIACLDPKKYEALLALHIPKSLPSVREVPNTSGYVLEDFKLELEARHKDFCNKLMASEKFKNFISTYCIDTPTNTPGEQPYNIMLNNLMYQIKAHNKRMDDEISNTTVKASLLLEPEKFSARYQEYKEQVLMYHQHHTAIPTVRLRP